MTSPWLSGRFRRLALAALIPALPILWFLTAPASSAVQRIVAGAKPGSFGAFISRTAESYEAPLVYVGRVPSLRRMSDTLEDFWGEVLAPPETTP